MSLDCMKIKKPSSIFSEIIFKIFNVKMNIRMAIILFKIKMSIYLTLTDTFIFVQSLKLTNKIIKSKYKIVI